MIGGGILRRGAVVLCAALVLSGGAHAGETLAHGLLWRNSPLPAVFPLVVKTPQGRDFYLRVEEPESGKAVLAAGITGGEFFKVLVPPGDYRLSFAYGVAWQGEAAGFVPGPETGQLVLDDPLRFEVQGVGRKAGHVVTLIERDGSFTFARKDQAICRHVTLSYEPAGPVQPGPDGRFLLDGEFVRSDAFDPEALPRRYGKDFPELVYGGWSYVCD